MSNPKIALVDGHYPAFKEITGLEFGISIVMRATDITFEQEVLRQQQAERLVNVWNSHEQLVAALKDVRERIKNSDEWWMDVPERGGLDLEAVEDALAAAGFA